MPMMMTNCGYPVWPVRLLTLMTAVGRGSRRPRVIEHARAGKSPARELHARGMDDLDRPDHQRERTRGVGRNPRESAPPV
ncbi:hypothetical protein DB30_00768 [Enhygromyxa salina]|uniref:Uncharacterized protein n=1 Tax=Enhygromyxa salina TaxID=215803 RepID=A0A0C2A4Z4_9BACT|nr:hypothetical protein DB30_00768 [Enhygromyxa salina]